MIQPDIANARKSLHYPTVLKQMKTFIDQYNASQQDKKLRLNSNIVATAEKITMSYLKQLHKALSLGDKFKAGLPGFRTYNRSLATVRHCTSKTIMNHKKRLKIAGFITEEVNHGGSGIEITINESIFSLNPTVSQSPTFSKTENQDASSISPLVKNLHTLVHEVLEPFNINSSVDNSDGIKGVSHTANESLIISDSGTPQERSGNTVESNKSISQDPIKKTEKPRQKNQETVGSDEGATATTTTNGSAAAASNKKGNTPEKKKQDRAKKYFNKEIPIYTKPKKEVFDKKYKINMIIDFWIYAKEILYAELQFTEKQEAKIKNLIWESVYGKFKVDATLEQAKKHQENLKKRVDMVSNWRGRRPEYRWIPLPEIYFNINNQQNGFDKTREWLLNAKKSKKYVFLKLEKERKNQKILDQVNKEWSDYEKGVGRHTNKSRFQLYQIQQKRISTLNDTVLNKLFQDVLNQNLTKKRQYASTEHSR